MGLGIFQQAQSEYAPADDNPLSRPSGEGAPKSSFGSIIAATMRGNAMVQGQSQAKEVASDQMSAPPTKLAFTGKSTPAGVPIVKIEAPVDVINGTQADDLKQAHDTPHQNVEKKLDQMGIGAVRDEDLKSAGYTPRTQRNVKPEDVTSYRGAYRAQRDLGEDPVSAAIFSSLQKLGLFRPDTKMLATDVNNAHTVQDTQAHQAVVDPIIKSEVALATAGNNAERLDFERASAARQARTEYYKRLDDVVGKTDYSQIPPEQWKKATEDQFGQEVPEFAAAKIARKGAQDIAKALDDFQSKGENKAALGTYATFDDAKKAFGRPLTQQQEEQFQQNWSASRRAYVRSDARAQADLDIKAATAFAAQRSNDLVAAAQRGTGEKALEGLPPNVQATVRGIANGSIDISKVTSGRDKERSAMAALVSSFDPTWSTALAPARAATFKDYYAGATKTKAIDPLNTAIHHLDDAKDSVVALQNAPVQVWNKIRQAGLQSLAGDPRYSKFVADVSLLSGEIAKLSKGGVPDKEELETVNKLLNSANSPAQLNGALDEYVKLMAGRAQPLTEGYVARTGTVPPPGLILTKSSEAILRKRGYDKIVDEITGSGAASGGADKVLHWNTKTKSWE